MKSLQELTQNIPLARSVRPIEPTSDDIGAMHRNEVIEMFRKRVNEERVGTKWKPLSFMAMQQKLVGLTKQDLHYTYRMCDKARSFGEKFFYELKVQK